MILNLLDQKLENLTASTLVVFSESASEKNKTTATIKHKDAQKLLQGDLDAGVITGRAMEPVLFRGKALHQFSNTLVIGIGSAKSVNAETIRQVAAAIFESVRGSKLKEAVVAFDSLTANKNLVAEYAQAFAEGATLASYSFDELKTGKKDKEEITLHLVSSSAKTAAVKKAFQDGLTLGQCVNFSRRLGDMPGNLMTPTILADTATDAAKGLGIKMTVWDKARIKKEKMGGLLGVSMGSDQEPRFIVMEYKGAAASKKPIVFVGKGLTFDSGGISIKPSASMEEMKYDMCGGANVIGALLAIARLKLKVNAYAVVASTENMPGPSATKPGDVHTARNGKTFEVNNTDAEGRLILADALCYASELKPQMIVDAATLTGAMVVALGNIHTGFYTRDEALAKRVNAAGAESGELVWRMPLVDFHGKDMKGTYADLSNMSSSKGAGSATAAAFLENFVEEGIPWAHFDIAGTGWAVGNRLNYCSKKGASGVMVRTFVELAKSYV